MDLEKNSYISWKMCKQIICRTGMVLFKIFDGIVLFLCVFLGLSFFMIPLAYYLDEGTISDVAEVRINVFLMLISFIPIIFFFFLSRFFLFFKHVEQLFWLAAFILIPYLYSQIPSMQLIRMSQEVQDAGNK